MDAIHFACMLGVLLICMLKLEVKRNVIGALHRIQPQISYGWESKFLYYPAGVLLKSPNQIVFIFKRHAIRERRGVTAVYVTVSNLKTALDTEV